MCDDSFDIREAHVVCKQLGYRRAKYYAKFAYFGQGNQSIWLDNLNCTGTEAVLYDCHHDGFGNHNCEHHEDAGVVCEEGIA